MGQGPNEQLDNIMVSDYCHPWIIAKPEASQLRCLPFKKEYTHFLKVLKVVLVHEYTVFIFRYYQLNPPSFYPIVPMPSQIIFSIIKSRNLPIPHLMMMAFLNKHDTCDNTLKKYLNSSLCISVIIKL